MLERGSGECIPWVHHESIAIWNVHTAASRSIPEPLIRACYIGEDPGYV